MSIKIKNKSRCSGCHACMAVCPVKCITMSKDDEGFLYPNIDSEKCIGCGLCKKACQKINPIKSERYPKSYACYNKDEKIRMRSSSGGIFYLIAKNIIDKGGVVFGAAFNDQLTVEHIFVENISELHRIQGAKYMQSRIGDAYIKAKQFLKEGRLVLFTGTPCQIDGLLHVLNKKYDNLYTQDCICHGVPSPLAWTEYLKYNEKVIKKRIDNSKMPEFRNKSLGWKTYSITYYFEDGTLYSKHYRDDIYMKAFLNDLILRPSCYSCASKTMNKTSDITLADFWGAEEIHPNLFDNKGLSLVFVNSEKGAELFEKISDQVVMKPTDTKNAVKNNSAAYISSPKPWGRKKFFERLRKSDFETAVSDSICEPVYIKPWDIAIRIQRKILKMIKS